MGFFRFWIAVFLVVFAIDYMRANVPGWENALKLPLPPLAPEVATDIANKTDELIAGAKQAVGINDPKPDAAAETPAAAESIAQPQAAGETPTAQ